MRSHLKSTIFLLFLVLLSSSYSSCDLINPDEQIPSYLKIDSIPLSVISGQGTDDHNIVDAWVFENEQLVGIYELPAIVPILQNGDANIRIRGGIKLNGQVASRIPYLFTEDFQSTIELFPDSQVSINPTLGFYNWVNFKWLEDFEGVGLSLAATGISEADPVRIDGSEAYEGKSLKLALDENQTFFECKTGLAYDLPSGGAPVLLEFTYRANNPFRVGIFSRDQTGTFQVVVMVLNASENWNRIYVNLTDLISSNAGFIDHQPFFGFIRDENLEGEAYVILDNIRMLH